MRILSDIKRQRTVKRASELLNDGRYPELAVLMGDAVERFPDDPLVRMLYACSLLPARPHDAPSQFARAIELDPDNAWNLAWAADMLIGAGDFDLARAYTARASEISPRDGWLGTRIANLKDKLAALDSPIDADPQLVVEMATFLVEQGRSAEAALLVNKALTAFPGDMSLLALRKRLPKSAHGAVDDASQAAIRDQLAALDRTVPVEQRVREVLDSPANRVALERERLRRSRAWEAKWIAPGVVVLGVAAVVIDKTWNSVLVAALTAWYLADLVRMSVKIRRLS